MLRGFRSVVSYALFVLLVGCAAPQPKTYTLLGYPVVGRIVRVEPAIMWAGGDAFEDGHIFWLRSDGPEQPLIVFASDIACPKPVVSEGHYVLTLAHADYGYQVDKQIEKELTGLIATSCTRVDPNDSFFRSWRDRRSD